MQSSLKVTRENCYNDSGNFKGIYAIGSIFRNNLPPISPEALHINNNLTMDLMKRIIEHIGTKGPVIKNIKMLGSKSMIDGEKLI